jgi:ABC-type polysaccharide/polyol phosphate transport system ATPase subunit
MHHIFNYLLQRGDDHFIKKKSNTQEELTYKHNKINLVGHDRQDNDLYE